MHEVDFTNTILPLEASAERSSLAIHTYFNLLSASSTDSLMEISAQVSSMLSDFGNEVSFDEELAGRVKKVYDQGMKDLDDQDRRLTQRTYETFKDSGVFLDARKWDLLKTLKKERAASSLQFGMNIVKEMNAYTLPVTDACAVEGIPSNVLEVAKEKAESLGTEGWVFDLSMPSYLGIMQYCKDREVRKKLYKDRAKLCFDRRKKTNNVALVHTIIRLRREIAQLMGYESSAEFTLKDRMLSSPDAVYRMLDDLRDSYLPLAREEVQAVTAYAHRAGLPQGESLMPWDWSYYTEGYKREILDFDQEATRPYFELSNVQSALFGLVDKLFDLRLCSTDSYRTYHSDVQVFEVYRGGHYQGLLLMDFFPRKGKQPGAWMTEYVEATKDQRPVVSLVMNFTPPTKRTPSLLSFDECTTFFHEFGHALHCLLTQGKYASLNGTNVVRDFVELPSQLLENWMRSREFIKGFARHYQSGEPISEQILGGLDRNAHFLEGYSCIRQLTFGYLDMAWHMTNDPDTDIVQMEKRVFAPLRLLPSASSGATSTSFSHIFDGGYASGYYGYKWSEILEADAFSEFQTHGLYHKPTADRFRECILERGDRADAMDLYVQFKGRKPTTEALKRRSGVL